MFEFNPIYFINSFTLFVYQKICKKFEKRKGRGKKKEI